MSQALHMPLPEWALFGNPPQALPQEFVTAMAVPHALEPGKMAQKWLKKHPDLPLLVVVVDETNLSAATELLVFLRERLQNGQVRLICFVDDTAKESFSDHMQHWHIHRLQSLRDWSVGFLRQLMLAEWDEYQRSDGQRQRRDSELALLTWLARSGRDEILGERHLREVAGLLTELVGATGLFTDSGFNLQGTWPCDRQSLDWHRVLELQFQNFELGDQPMRVQLNADLPVHDAAATVLDGQIRGSIVIPFRCYEEIRGYLLLLLSPECLAVFDVGTVNLLEKTSDQLRALLERQQSEQRLRVQYDRLQETLKKLYSTQEQLFHAEKLSSLGQLAAGIAHEINNPVSYVLSNFEPLDEYISGMSELIQLHDQFARTLDAGDEQLREQLLTRIQDREKSIDLEFVLEDVFALVADSRNGLARVCDIVKNLKNFAHKDQVEYSDFDLVNCYRDSIGILKHQINGTIEVKERLPEKALIPGNSGMLGQVFINLIQNSLQAMGGSGTLSVVIEESEDQWLVVLQDTGPGIPDDLHSKIFDPFFTTKPVGQGTGLGLSTVYSIIERHQGNIRVENPPEGGARFVIGLPMVQSVS